MSEQKRAPIGAFGSLPPAEKPNNFKGGIKRLLAYMKPELALFAAVILLAIGGTALSIVSPRILGRVTNALQTGIMRGALDMPYITSTIILVISLYIGAAILGAVSAFMSAGVAQRVVYRMRRDIKAKLARLPVSYFDTNSSGAILSRLTNDAETIATSLQQSITQAITGVISLIGIFIMMLLISGYMTLIAVAALPVFLIITLFIVKKSQKHFSAQQKNLGELNGYVEEIYSARKIVKLYGGEAKAADEFAAHNEALAQAGVKANFYSGIIFPALHFVNNLSYVAICVVGGVLAGAANPLMIGDIQAFIQYSQQFSQPVMQTATIAGTIQSTIAAAERIFALLDEAEEPADAAAPKTLAGRQAEVEFRGVNFSYDKDKELIKDLNLRVHSGQTVAIVGPTGAGKTTLINLLMRFYEIDGGSILIDGIDIRHLKKSELRRAFGMVLQDTWLRSGTIAENIAYGKEGATREQVVAAAKAAHADHFITTLPDGYDTVLGEDADNISDGQKQLLTIARAVLADPKFLILDEATSSVDTRTEAYIQNAMTKMMRSKTSFVIAHRLSTIRSASKIIVMDGGKIVEQGTHGKLLAQKGFYYNLYNSQF
jgi:ATP-binding cassette subfamily B protein